MSVRNRAEGQPLWSDERIDTTIQNHAPYRVGGTIRCMSQGTAHILLIQMRDEYEARIAELEAQLAAQQMPDEMRKAIFKLTDYGMPLGITNDEWSKWRWIVVDWLTDGRGG